VPDPILASTQCYYVSLGSKTRRPDCRIPGVPRLRGYAWHFSYFIA